MKITAICLTGTLLAFAPRASAAPVSSTLTDRERAVRIVSLHLLKMIGTQGLAQAVESKRIRGDGYWQDVFQKSGRPDLYSEIQDELRISLKSVPLVKGMPAKPDVFAKSVVLSFSPLPLVPVSDLTPQEQKKVNAFALGPLLLFQMELFRGAPVTDSAKASLSTSKSGPFSLEYLSREAEKTFQTPAISENFKRFSRLCLERRDFEADANLIGAKDKINEWLHLYGLHLVLDQKSFSEGQIFLKCYVILDKFAYDVLGTPFVIYETKPTTKEQTSIALGHAETELGYLFLFSQEIDTEIEADWDFLANDGMGNLWVTNEQGLLETTGELPESIVTAIETEIRNSATNRVPTAMTKGRYRSLFIDSIAQHEGFHKYIDPALRASVTRGKVTGSDISTLHERGAYLYQLETADPAFVSMNLHKVVFTALNTRSLSIPNMDGARRALRDLQVQLRQVRFWDTDNNRPIKGGLIELFRLSPPVIKKAASQARWGFESELAR